MFNVDIIIPNGGGLATLKRLLKDVVRLSDVNINHIIVVCQDDEKSEEWLREKEKEIDNLFVIYNTDNIPPPIPYNDGLDLSSQFKNFSDYIHFLDDDIEIKDITYLFRMLVDMNKNDLDLCATEHCYFGPRPIPTNIRDFGMGTFLMHRKVFNKLGFLDEIYDFHCSDSDYCMRARNAGFKIDIIRNSIDWLIHYHQIGTIRKFQGKHQSIINNDWKKFHEKWSKNNVVNSIFTRTKVDIQERRKRWSEKCKNAVVK